MAEQQFKRNIAYKYRIGNILSGKPSFEGERFIGLELDGKRVVRVNIIGSIVDKYESEGERKFLSITIDDGSGQIKIKTFADDVDKFNSFNQGQTILVIGTMRSFNDELYIAPEMMREQDPRYLVVRKLEVGEIKEPQTIQTNSVPKSESMQGSVKDKLIDLIKEAEKSGGANTEELIQKIGDAFEVNQELQKLLEEGMIFEPRPGVVRWLG